MNFLALLRTIPKLGLRKCAIVAVYRLCKSVGIYQKILPIHPCPIPEPIDRPWQPDCIPVSHWSEASRESCISVADALLAGRCTWFSREVYELGCPPDWFLDPSSRQSFADGSRHWSTCKDFLGADIKRCWEQSRWSWAPLLVRAWRLTGDSRYRDGLNSWIDSWCIANPVNGGTNWACGQEASIRLLHVMQAWYLSDGPGLTPKNTPGRVAFVASHLQRISFTQFYAQAQDNNHWISEAAALFIGGSWLATSVSSCASIGFRFAKEGTLSLERSVSRLVCSDGSFAQHSLTYHRLLLDTLCQVELWRRLLNRELFSEVFYHRCRAATSWLNLLVDVISGDGPNLGNNDGALCYQFSCLPYRDFRPTLQLASVVFEGKPSLPSGPWDESLYWLDLVSADMSTANIQQKLSDPIMLLPHGGYALLRPCNSSWGLLRLPTYCFRPAHSDPLHFDLWHCGVNLLRDGGSYAYNASSSDISYFPGIASHNTVQFDGAEPMPRLGRFLWGDWLRLEEYAEVTHRTVSASYSSPNGRHQRRVTAPGATGLHWTITDFLSGFQQEARLRWRLCPCDWRLEGFTLVAPLATLHISSDQPITALELVHGWESLYYGTKTILPVLEITVSQAPATLTTSIQLSSVPLPCE